MIWGDADGDAPGLLEFMALQLLCNRNAVLVGRALTSSDWADLSDYCGLQVCQRVPLHSRCVSGVCDFLSKAPFGKIFLA
jgi:hypothetical protein